jgi:hypothetical protein
LWASQVAGIPHKINPNECLVALPRLTLSRDADIRYRWYGHRHYGYRGYGHRHFGWYPRYGYRHW